MSYGACDHCGCSHHECECRAERPIKNIHETGIWNEMLADILNSTSTTQNSMTDKIREFTCHGTYINDFTCFEMERKLGLDEAFMLLTRSAWVKEKPVSRADCRHSEYFLLNKGWSIVEIDRDLGVIKAVYNHDGFYSLRVASLQSFLNATDSMASWHRDIRNLRTELMAPHEHA